MTLLKVSSDTPGENLFLDGNRPDLVGTLKEQAVQRIKEAIYKGDLPPGRIFSHEQLSQWLGISRTPIREALLELQNSGLVIIHRNKGTEVVPLTRGDVLEIFEMREALEVKAFELAIERISERDLLVIKRFFLSHLEQAHSGQKVEFLQGDRQFHLLIAQASGNRRLYNAIEALREQFIRIGVYALFNERRIAEVVSEHQVIMDALVAKDAVRIRAAMLHHLGRTCDEVILSLDQAAGGP